ncbi:MAG: maltose alpha-D-glucosyltransferase [Burkholderiales bacterium]|nr:maltose alpha-D-glucosyltransferase [Burkholderiales bacterium]
MSAAGPPQGTRPPGGEGREATLGGGHIGADPLWYKDAVIYQVHVKAFRDSNGDGIGDFPGLTESLPYIRDLGVNTVWLLPFYPSPLRDDGYDIADYHGVHPHYGTLADFRHFLREAHRHDLKVITELVINHTSDQHPWFQAARRAPPGSSKRNYYVWSDTDTRWPETRIIFTDTEKSNWTWDPVAKQYYWHRFFSHQPDLNFANPNVMRAVARAMRYWFDMGVDGMRLDAIPYLCERDGTINENLPETHAVLKHMRAELDRNYSNRFFLAEVNQWPEDVRPYFGDGDECHMAFHFPLMPRIYMALAEEDRHAITDIMGQTPEIPANCQWAIFLRNHDELTLEMVTERERDYLYRTYAADRQMRINLGIRRRLAPLLDNNRRKIELLTSLLLSMIGSPVMYYGDEIGMGDNIFLGDRNGVRTPMQWSPDRNGGFSRADPQRLYLPPVMDPVYGYPAVNVEAQTRSPASLLNWTRRLVAARKAHAAFSRGSVRFLRPGNRKVLAYLRTYGDEVLLCVANLARSSQPVELALGELKGRIPVELLGNTPFPPIGDLPYFLTLPAWGFYWFSLSTQADSPRWHVERPVPYEFPVLVIPEGLMAALTRRDPAKSDLRALLARRVREQLEQEVLPQLLPQQHWFDAKGRTVVRARLSEQSEWATPSGNWLIAMAQVELDDGSGEVYALPLALAWEEGDGARLQELLHCTIARVRQRARIGIVYDAFWDDAFPRAVVDAIARNAVIEMPGGTMRFSATHRLAAVGWDPSLPVKHPAHEQTNTLVILGERVVLKGFRRLRRGTNPEIEMGRFLTEVSPFANIAGLCGSAEYVNAKGEAIAVAVLHAYVSNEGSGWDYTLAHLRRLIDDALAQGGEAPQRPVTADTSLQGAFDSLMETLGKRTGELHAALAHTSGDPAFDPEPFTAADLAALRDKLADEAAAALATLPARLASLTDDARADAGRLLARADALRAYIGGLVPQAVAARKTRYHGHYHLGQVLISKHDFVIIDFEGDPSRPMEARRAKHSPLRDVASMLRSFGYAAAVAARHGRASTPADHDRVRAALERWRKDTTQAFLTGYRAATAAVSSYPAEPAIAAALLEAFLLEKALDELRYELAHRADWVGIPLAAVLELVPAA